MAKPRKRKPRQLPPHPNPSWNDPIVFFDDIDPPGDAIAALTTERLQRAIDAVAAEVDGVYVFSGMGPMRESDAIARITNRGGGKSATLDAIAKEARNVTPVDTGGLRSFLTGQTPTHPEVVVVRPSPAAIQARMIRARVALAIGPALSKSLARWADNGAGDRIRGAVKAGVKRKRGQVNGPESV